MLLRALLKTSFLFGVCFSFQVLAVNSDSTSAFNYVNELRKKAGMLSLKTNTQLNQAANNHAHYCALNKTGGHYEQKVTQGYTGYDHIERIIAVGYPSRNTGENVSSHVGNGSDKVSVDGLMSAIYHRFGFLNLEYDEMGVGKSDNGSFSSYVYNLGNSEKAKLCNKTNHETPGKYFTSVCGEEAFRVSELDFINATSAIQKNNPSIVMWPASNSSDVPPVFFEESPDPLPGYGVSGYPVSIEFNPIYFEEEIPTVRRFDLIDLETGKTLELIKYINKDTDLHKKFTEYQHAIFPLERLKWGSEYRVELDYWVGAENVSMHWFFHTRKFDIPIYTVVENNPVIKEQESSSFVIYMPPKHSNDAEMAYSTKYRGLSKIDIQLIDGNTLQVNTKGRGEAEITFHGTVIKVII